MKRLVVLVGCCVFLLAVVGCGRQVRLGGETREDVFPEVMVGVWETEPNPTTNARWGIKFEPDGSIKKIIHILAWEVNISEGGRYMEAVKDPNHYAAFAMGPCEAKYIPETGVLEVRIVVDHYVIQVPSPKVEEGLVRLEGRMEDIFSGPISEDGEIWKVKKLSYSTLKGYTLPSKEYADAHPDTLIFHKLDLTQIREEDSVQ